MFFFNALAMGTHDIPKPSVTVGETHLGSVDFPAQEDFVHILHSWVSLGEMAFF